MRSVGADPDLDFELLVAVEADEQVFEKRDGVQIVLA